MRKQRRKLLFSSTVSVVRATTIDILPDDALLQIFDFCRVGHKTYEFPYRAVWQWQRLIHVCRRWRLIIFSSPRRLDLYLICKHGTPVRKNLDLWPAFPIIIDYFDDFDRPIEISPDDDDNIIAALEHPDRVRCLKLHVTSSLLGKVATIAQEPFLILTQLSLSSERGSVVPVLPSAFLGGSNPRLREIYLGGIPFPTLPTLLSSASNLVDLSLYRIPDTGYISPEVMVTSLAALTRLNFLLIGFQSSTSRPDQSVSIRTHAAPPTRVVLPALTKLGFGGASEYLEDLVARIDTPRLAYIGITYFNQLVFQVPQLFRFIGRTQIIKQAMDAKVYSTPSEIWLNLLSGLAELPRTSLYLQISCRGLDWQVSHLADVLSQSSAVLPNVHHLDIYEYYHPPRWQGEMDDIEWLALIRQFTTLETLRVSHQQTEHVAHTLNNVTVEMVPEILPALRLLCLEDEPAGRVEKFITARQLAGLPPIGIVNTEKEYKSMRRPLPP